MAITEKINNTTVPTFWEGEIPVRYVYTYGLAGEKFFRAVKDKGTFLGTRCEDCDITFVPPKIYCDRCFNKLDKYIDVGITGYVETFTITFHNMDGSEKKVPRVLAMIRIGDTDGGIIHYLDESIDYEQIAIGMPVKAVLKPKGQRKGSIEDIVGFKAV
ncbi:MAG: Zn-ribbon domain-containing OB-fold protein [Candidatus Krumholzibacteriota bacterium]|nr:Zn-ribbon domain-containing OB-fold protein [Candidatus Krumholzibacteriota bacterium]